MCGTALVALKGPQFKSQQQARFLTTTVTPVPPADSGASWVLCSHPYITRTCITSKEKIKNRKKKYQSDPNVWISFFWFVLGNVQIQNNFDVLSFQGR